MTFWWILFYILWFCENWKYISPLLLALQDGWTNLISSIWNESNLILLDQKSVSRVLKHAITPRYIAIAAKVAHCYHWGKYTLIEKTVQYTFWKIKWPFLAHNLVRRLLKAGSYGHYRQSLKEDASSDLQKWVKDYSPRISITNQSRIWTSKTLIILTNTHFKFYMYQLYLCSWRAI